MVVEVHSSIASQMINRMNERMNEWWMNRWKKEKKTLLWFWNKKVIWWLSLTNKPSALASWANCRGSPRVSHRWYDKAVGQEQGLVRVHLFDTIWSRGVSRLPSHTVGQENVVFGLFSYQTSHLMSKWGWVGGWVKWWYCVRERVS